jgi:hypothetical protein
MVAAHAALNQAAPKVPEAIPINVLNMAVANDALIV